MVSIPLQSNAKFLLRRVSISVRNSTTKKLTLHDTYLCGSWNTLKIPRQRLSLASKELLERIFLVKQSPNREERGLIAEKCGVSPLQIRVWVCIPKGGTHLVINKVSTNYDTVHKQTDEK